MVDRAVVKPIVGTGEFAEVDPQWVFRADVLVQLGAPAAVVEGRNDIQVLQSSLSSYRL